MGSVIVLVVSLCGCFLIAATQAGVYENGDWFWMILMAGLPLWILLAKVSVTITIIALFGLSLFTRK